MADHVGLFPVSSQRVRVPGRDLLQASLDCLCVLGRLMAISETVDGRVGAGPGQSRRLQDASLPLVQLTGEFIAGRCL